MLECTLNRLLKEFSIRTCMRSRKIRLAESECFWRSNYESEVEKPEEKMGQVLICTSNYRK